MRGFGQVIGMQLMRQRPGDLAHIIAGAGFAFQPIRGKINDGVVVARESRGIRGADSIAAQGSDKTNEEVLAKLLT